MKNTIKLITVILFTFFTLQAQSETKIHITTGFTPPVSTFYASVLKEIDKKLSDVSISFEVLPAERSLILSNDGTTDGECCRIPAVVAKQYKNLVPVNESFFSAQFSAFTKKKLNSIKKFSDLKPYSVGSVKGWKIAVIKVKEAKPAEVHIVTTPEQMFRMINKGRLDYGVVGHLSGLKSIANLGLKEIHAVKPPLIEKPLYLVLHKKHKHLIPEFDRIILNMKKDGTINKIYQQLLQSIK